MILSGKKNLIVKKVLIMNFKKSVITFTLMTSISLPQFAFAGWEDEVYRTNNGLGQMAALWRYLDSNKDSINQDTDGAAKAALELMTQARITTAYSKSKANQVYGFRDIDPKENEEEIWSLYASLIKMATKARIDYAKSAENSEQPIAPEKAVLEVFNNALKPKKRTEILKQFKTNRVDKNKGDLHETHLAFLIGLVVKSNDHVLEGDITGLENIGVLKEKFQNLGLSRIIDNLKLNVSSAKNLVVRFEKQMQEEKAAEKRIRREAKRKAKRERVEAEKAEKDRKRRELEENRLKQQEAEEERKKTRSKRKKILNEILGQQAANTFVKNINAGWIPDLMQDDEEKFEGFARNLNKVASLMEDKLNSISLLKNIAHKDKGHGQKRYWSKDDFYSGAELLSKITSFKKNDTRWSFMDVFRFLKISNPAEVMANNLAGLQEFFRKINSLTDDQLTIFYTAMKKFFNYSVEWTKVDFLLDEDGRLAARLAQLAQYVDVKDRNLDAFWLKQLRTLDDEKFDFVIKWCGNIEFRNRFFDYCSRRKYFLEGDVLAVLLDNRWPLRSYKGFYKNIVNEYKYKRNAIAIATTNQSLPAVLKKYFKGYMVLSAALEDLNSEETTNLYEPWAKLIHSHRNKKILEPSHMPNLYNLKKDFGDLRLASAMYAGSEADRKLIVESSKKWFQTDDHLVDLHEILSGFAKFLYLGLPSGQIKQTVDVINTLISNQDKKHFIVPWIAKYMRLITKTDITNKKTKPHEALKLLDSIPLNVLKQEGALENFKTVDYIKNLTT